MEDQEKPEGTVTLLLDKGTEEAAGMNHKRRGVKPGEKRGPYKKTQVENAIVINDVHQQKHEEFKNKSEIVFEEVKAAQETKTAPIEEPEVRQEAQQPPKPDEPFKPKYNTDLFN